MTAGIKVNTSGLWQYSTIMKYLPRSFQVPIFKSSLRKFEKTGEISPRILQLENLILDDLADGKINEIRTQIKAKHLFLHLGQVQDFNLSLRSVLLLKSILKTRGKLRWLCFRLMPDSFANSYEISRGKLLMRVIAHWKTFKVEVLEKLFISETVPNNVTEIDNYEYTHPNLKFEFSMKELYLLDGELAKDLDFGLGRNPSKKALRKFLLGRLVIWDSSAVLNLIRLRDNLSSHNNVNSFLQHVPDLKVKISRQAKLLVNIHPNASMTFDERLDRGHRTPDILHNVDIWHQRFIVQAETWHVVDSTCSPYAEFVAGHWQFLESIPNHIEHAYIKKPQKFNRVEIKQAIYLLGRADENWYHLLLDTLPRYLQLKDIKQDVPVLVRSDLPETTISLIKSLISHKIIFVMPKDLVSVEKLFFVAARSTVHDSMPTNGEDQVKFSPQTIKELREWVLSRLHFENVLHLPKNIFIPRRSKYRNLINTDQARACLEAFDFVTVETNDDFYLKQHLYFNQANHIVSPGGAVLANIVFMNQGSRISLFRSWRDSDLLLWKKLADSCGVQFNEAIGIPTYYGSKTLARQHSNFFLPKRLIRKLLRL